MADPKEWTLMFYFASDNALAPSIVSQLKALKNAGFHPEANVIARFDPHTEGTPTHTFDVNLTLKLGAQAKSDAVKKLEDSGAADVLSKLDAAHLHSDSMKTQQVGFPAGDPSIRNLVYDKLWGDATIPNGADGREKKIKDLIRNKLAGDVGDFLSHEVGLGDDVVRSTVEGNGLIKYDPPDPNPFILQASAGNGSAEGNGAAPPRSDSEGVTVADKAALAADKAGPRQSLEMFLKFCAEEYPAKHYMLFILGHGLVVGNDVFLLDDHADKPSLSLKELGDVLGRFNSQYKKAGDLELIGFHSCSMSSIEVAYELEGQARYMLASQGPEFVGSWPYTQILVRVFNDLNELKQIEDAAAQDDATSETADAVAKNIEDTVTKIFHYCFYNSYDFQMAGYSFDLALCDLRGVSEKTAGAIGSLASELRQALGGGGGPADECIKGLVLLAHWDAQSFWRESYTDLYDFCLCLSRRCRAAAQAFGESGDALGRIQDACDVLMRRLLGDGGVVMHSGFAGPSYQYSHGLSVFFPWSQPDNAAFWPREYNGYQFEKAGWRDFLQCYFDNTMRAPRHDEAGHEQLGPEAARDDESNQLDAQLLEGITAHIFERAEGAQLGPAGDASGKGSGSDATGKGSGSDATGDCDCPNIKNYPSFTHRPRRKDQAADAAVAAGAHGRPTYLILPE